MSCEMYFYDLIINIIEKWNLKKVGAISIWVYANELYEYQSINNFYEVVIGYFPIDKIRSTKELQVEWDTIDEVEVEFILEPFNYGDTARILLDWLITMGIKDIGVEDFDAAYDLEMNYIGKGPNGYFEVLTMISEVIKKIKINKAGKDISGIPVIIHDLEWTWLTKVATLLANPNGEARDFIEYYNKNLK